MLGAPKAECPPGLNEPQCVGQPVIEFSTDQGDSTKLLLQPGLSLGPSIPPQVVSRSAPVCASEGLTQHQVFALDIVVNYSSEAGANTKLRLVANQIARARNG